MKFFRDTPFVTYRTPNGHLLLKDGPDIATKEWWLNGERHREDGPAIEYSAERAKSYRYIWEEEMTDKWYLHGKCIDDCSSIQSVMKESGCSKEVATRVWNLMQVYKIMEL